MSDNQSESDDSNALETIAVVVAGTASFPKYTDQSVVAARALDAIETAANHDLSDVEVSVSGSYSVVDELENMDVEFDVEYDNGYDFRMFLNDEGVTNDDGEVIIPSVIQDGPDISEFTDGIDEDELDLHNWEHREEIDMRTGTDESDLQEARVQRAKNKSRIRHLEQIIEQDADYTDTTPDGLVFIHGGSYQSEDQLDVLLGRSMYQIGGNEPYGGRLVQVNVNSGENLTNWEHYLVETGAKDWDELSTEQQAMLREQASNEDLEQMGIEPVTEAQGTAEPVQAD